MGSVNTPDNPVVNKYQTANQAMIKHSRRIKSTQSGPLSQAEHGDTTTVEQTDPLPLARPLDAAIVVGIINPGRQVNARIASIPANAPRVLSVDKAGNVTQEVIPTSLQPHTPQIGVKHGGGKVIVSNTVGDTTTRIDN